jgi:hypothetical protein
MKRSELLKKLSTIKLDTAYADRWFVLCGDVNARDHGAAYVNLDQYGFNCRSVYPFTHDSEDCDLVTSWQVSDYGGSYADLINCIDIYVNNHTSGDLPSLTGFMDSLIYEYISHGFGHDDSQITTEPTWLFNVNGSVPPLAFHLA